MFLSTSMLNTKDMRICKKQENLNFLKNHEFLHHTDSSAEMSLLLSIVHTAFLEACNEHTVSFAYVSVTVHLLTRLKRINLNINPCKKLD